MTWGKELGMEIGSAIQHPIEGDEHGVMEVMMARSFKDVLAL